MVCCVETLFLMFLYFFIINNNKKMVANALEKLYLCRQFVIYCGYRALLRGLRHIFMNVLYE